VTSSSKPKSDALRAAEAGPLIAPQPERMTWRAWAGILVALAGALALSFSVNERLHNRVPFIFMYPVVAVAGYLGGWRPAVLVSLVAAVTLYVGHPALPVQEPQSAILCTIFLLGTGLMGWLSEELHRARRSARAGAAALRDLPEAQARFTAIAQTSPDALWIWDMSAGRIVFISRASKKLTGLSPEEVCAQTKAECWAQIYPKDAPTVEEAMRVLAAAPDGQTVEYEYRLRHRDGSWRWLRNRAGVFARSADGAAAQIFGHSEDVTERREMTATLAQRAAELARVATEREALLEAERAARGEAERANRLKDDFLATVSHELRTPLTAMLGWTAMLAEDAKDPELRQGLDVISRNAKAQRQLVEDLLDMSRIMSGKMRVEPQPVLLPQVVGAAIDTVTHAAEARGVTLLSQIGECEEPIQADANRLQQIVWNLLSNAVKFTPAGGQVCIRAQCAGDEARITVTDTGRGMAPEFVPHVFERFRQEDAATTRKAGGLGLGLAIVKHLVELHGGTITAHSEGLGKGSVFTVILPLHCHRTSSRFHRSAADAGATGQGSRTALAGRRLLVIDDEADTRTYLHRVLTERGAQVSVAGNAADGLRCAIEARPEAIICDISMPGEDGYSFVRNLRRAEDPAVRAIRAAALTALARGEDRERALDAGFNEHFAKPVEPAELVALVKRLLPSPAAQAEDLRQRPKQ
jgi:PAS domain S-box-containing protein